MTRDKPSPAIKREGLTNKEQGSNCMEQYFDVTDEDDNLPRRETKVWISRSVQKRLFCLEGFESIIAKGLKVIF